LYPNPANDEFTINSDTNKVHVYSITGQLVKSFDKQASTYQFSISDLNKGVYFVKVVDSNNRENTVKLIKQ
jgi:hypothetical protein